MLFPLSLSVFGMVLVEECSWSSYGFSWMFFIVLDMFLARTKRLWILIQKGCLVIIVSDGWYDCFSNNWLTCWKGVWKFCTWLVLLLHTYTYFTFHTIPITYTISITFSNLHINTHTPLLLSPTGHPAKVGYFWGF